jgi:hypothetical protein
MRTSTICLLVAAHAVTPAQTPDSHKPPWWRPCPVVDSDNECPSKGRGH